LATIGSLKDKISGWEIVRWTDDVFATALCNSLQNAKPKTNDDLALAAPRRTQQLADHDSVVVQLSGILDRYSYSYIISI
jgi:hypothetical protein